MANRRGSAEPSWSQTGASSAGRYVPPEAVTSGCILHFRAKKFPRPWKGASRDPDCDPDCVRQAGYHDDQSIEDGVDRPCRLFRRRIYCDPIADALPEWPGLFHPPVQEAGLSLLRLGRQLQGNEVRQSALGRKVLRTLLTVTQRLHQVSASQVRRRKPPSRVHRIAPSVETPHHCRPLHQWPREGHLRSEYGANRDLEEG